MSAYSWVETLVASQVDGSALTNTTTATSILPASSKIILPAGFIDRLGKGLRIRASGRVSNVVTTPGTLTLDVRFGSTTVFTGGAMNLNATAQTNATWELDLELLARAVGTSASLLGVGSWRSRSVVGSVAAASGGVGTLLLPDTAPAAGTTFDSTQSQTVDLFATWSIANASNSITLHNFTIQALN